MVAALKNLKEGGDVFGGYEYNSEFKMMDKGFIYLFIFPFERDGLSI